MAKDQRRNTARILAMPGMHVRSANPAEYQIDKSFTLASQRRVSIANLAGLCTDIEKRFHFAVNPPSTINTMPVT